jgi:hypothetical protein
MMHLNTCAVVDAFQAAGFEARYVPPPTGPTGPGRHASPGDEFILRRGDDTLRLGPSIVEQMLFEGLSLEDLVASVQAQYEAYSAEADLPRPRGVELTPEKVHILVTFRGMEDLWRASRDMTRPNEELPELRSEGIDNAADTA